MVSFRNTLKYCGYRNIQFFLTLLPTTTENEFVTALGDSGRRKKLVLFCCRPLLAVVGWLWPVSRPSPSHYLHPLLNRTGRESKMKKLMGQHKDREVTYQVLSWATQTQLREN